MINGVSDFESQRSLENRKMASDNLHDLTEDSAILPVFVLLVTSPSRTRKTGDSFEAEERLSLDDAHCNEIGGA